MASDVLMSWKEIAAYLGKGVRAVQRWEREIGLPVRRLLGKNRIVVLAIRPELDAWLCRTGPVERAANGRHSSLPCSSSR